jgi:hypothetical protein
VTPEQTAGAVRPAVLKIGAAQAESPHTLRRARQLGLTGWAFYVVGRGGALGDVRPDTAAAALGFIAPDAVHDGWEAAGRVAAPSAIAGYAIEEYCRWGDEVLSPPPRLIELAGRVVLAADPTGLPLFAAWRSMPVPDSGPGGRAAVLLHLLYEHRMGAHLVAARAVGLSPLEAVVAGPDGEPGAVAFGWQPPFPPPEPLVRKRIWAEALTDRVAGEAYRVLDVSERIELVELLEATAAKLP